MGHLILKLRPHRRDLRSASEAMNRQARNRRTWHVTTADLRTISGGNALRSQTYLPNRQRKNLASRTRPDLSAQERVYLRDRHPSEVSELLGVQEDGQRKALREKVPKLGLRDHQHHLAPNQRKGGRKILQKTYREKVKVMTSNLKIQKTGKGNKKVTKTTESTLKMSQMKARSQENQRKLLK